ncbi:SWR1-complex protein 4 [Linum perenne]
MVLSQTKQQERKDNEVVTEAKKITESRMAARGAEPSVMPVVEKETVEATINHNDTIVPPSNVRLAPVTDAPSTLVIADTSSTLASLRMLPVYLRTYALEQMVQQASSIAGLRTIKRVEQTLQDLGINLKPRVPTKAVCAEHLELRKEILTLLNLQKQLQHKEAEGSSFREGTYSEMPGTPKDRAFISDAMSFGGERAGRKDQKRKGPGRVSDTPSSPANKRPRKMKASEL